MIEMLDNIESNIGLIYAYKCFPSRMGGTKIYDFVQGRLSTLQNMSSPSTTTSGWNVSFSAGGYGYIGFDGIDDRIFTSGLLGNLPTLTLMALINLTAFDASGSEVISLGDCVGLRIDDATVPRSLSGFYHYPTNWHATAFSITLQGTGWQHVAYVVDPGRSSQRLYLNGNLKASTTFTDAIDYTGQGADTIFGRHGNGDTTTDFTGFMDDFRIFKRALSDIEIYKASVAAFLRPDIEAVGLSELYYLPSIRPVQDYVR